MARSATKAVKRPAESSWRDKNVPGKLGEKYREWLLRTTHNQDVADREVLCNVIDWNAVG